MWWNDIKEIRGQLAGLHARLDGLEAFLEDDWRHEATFDRLDAIYNRLEGLGETLLGKDAPKKPKKVARKKPTSCASPSE